MTKVMVHPHRGRYLRGLVDCVSITYPEMTTAPRTFYYGAAWLKDATMRVQPSGVARAQFENRRNVHAWAVGELITIFHTQYPHPPVNDSHGEWEKVTYHYESGEFRFFRTGENVTGMTFPYAHIVGRDLFVLDNRPST